ncbi:HTH domain-containing protein, partial [Enterobacter hormaechei]|uniref:HTH domain-containing protein n=2 Tax=Enterobacter hormaechei TaxID=158836 RepID=UPI003966A9AC
GPPLPTNTIMVAGGRPTPPPAPLTLESLMAPSPRSRSAERLVDIIIALHRNGSVNRRDLMQKFGITERTVYRDLQALSPIIEHDGKGRYQLLPAYQPCRCTQCPDANDETPQG